MTAPRESLPPAPERAPDFSDDFASGVEPARWIAHYLPHGTTPDRSAARVTVTPAGLELRIENDQPAWRPEDAPMRVSNLQTGTFSGPAGSSRGTHRHRPDGLIVRTATPKRLLWAPSRGHVEVTVTATADPGCMLAAWLVGTEHLSSQDAGEICLFEIDADAVGSSFRARTGIKAHGDPRLVTDMAEIDVALDARQPHTWTAIWGDGETIIGCGGSVVRRLPQAPDYPLFLMIDLFESAPTPTGYPKTATVSRVRGWEEAPRIGV